MLDKITEIVRTSPSSAYQEGWYAKFQRIDSVWGLKFYRSENMRDKTYKFQQLAAKIKCAPALGQKFDITLPERDAYGDPRIVYGYVTECIDILYYEYHGYEVDVVNEDDLEYIELLRKLSGVMDVFDMHGGNVGYLRGKLVAIDFSGCDPLPTAT